MDTYNCPECQTEISEEFTEITADSFDDFRFGATIRVARCPNEDCPSLGDTVSLGYAS